MKQKAKTLGSLCFIIQTLLCVSHQLQNIGRDAEKKSLKCRLLTLG